MSKWLRRILKGLGILIGVLIVLVIGLVAYAQLAWNRPESRPAPQMTGAREAQTVARGEYLYNYTLLCWTCHGSQGSHSPEELQAGGREFDATGIGPGFGWTEEQFITALRTGLRPDGTVMPPVMPWPWYARWGEDDLRAVWLYLRSLEPVVDEVPPSTLAGAGATGTGAARGEALFDVYCRTCHGKQRAGGSPTAVVLKDVARGMDDAALAEFITKGPPGTAMPGFGKTLTDEQIADLITFIRAW